MFKDSDIINRPVFVVYKPSRYNYTLDHAIEDKNNSLKNHPLVKELLRAHQNNLSCIDKVQNTLIDLGINFTIKSRTEVVPTDITDHFVISVGGDGTLLDTSHACKTSPILGVNSDPNSSIGALCAANTLNFREMFLDIYRGKLKPTPLTRLSIKIDGKPVLPLALNDVLFCNKNPAAMTRFSISLNSRGEHHRSSGIWIATAAGSTGGIYSAGSSPIALEEEKALFRLREPYWSDSADPQLLHGELIKNQTLSIISNMTDGEIFIDGPHKTVSIVFASLIEFTLADQPLWLFDGPNLKNNRRKIIEQRRALHNVYSSKVD